MDGRFMPCLRNGGFLSIWFGMSPSLSLGREEGIGSPSFPSAAIGPMSMPVCGDGGVSVSRGAKGSSYVRT